jgi:hypothetical protein
MTLEAIMKVDIKSRQLEELCTRELESTGVITELRFRYRVCAIWLEVEVAAD